MEKTPTTASSFEPTAPIYYAPLGGDLSQGDIVQRVPWGLIDDPVSICKVGGAAHHAKVHSLAQSPKAFTKGKEQILARADLGLGMVLWPNCEIDKFKEKGAAEHKWFAGVAPVVPMSGLPEGPQESIRAKRRRPFFYVPKNEPLGIPESYVDLRHLWPVKQSLLTERVAAISGDALLALQHQLLVFLTHMKLRESVVCPKCAESFPLAGLEPHIVDEHD